MGKGTEPWLQLYSWWVSKEPPDTLTEQDLHPSGRARGMRSLRSPQLWHLSWASISGFSPKGPGSLCPASQQLMTAWPARPLKTSLAIFTLEEVAGCPLPELCQHGMLLRKVDCDRQMGHCLKSQSCGQGQDVSVGTSGGVGRNLHTVSEFRDNSTLERLTLSPTGCASDFIILAGNAGVVCL